MYFIIFGSEADYGRVRMNDILDEKNVLYIPPVLYKANNLQKLLWRIHNSHRLNRSFNIPLKNIWYKFFYDTNFIRGDGNVYFIFEEYSPVPYDEGFLKHLKNTYPIAKFVFLFSNPIDKRLESKLCYLNSMFDLLITFDKNDAHKHNLGYFPSHYSKLPLKSGNEEGSDVFFIGADKGRLDKILNVFERLRAKGFSCDFNIVNVKENKKKYPDEITYNKRLNYIEVLNKIQNTKCILEIVQVGQVGPTLRSLEAVAYNKKLLTNNTSIVNEPFYKNEYISIFNDIDKLDFSFLKSSNEKINYNFIEHISPKKLMMFIKEHFERTN